MAIWNQMARCATPRFALGVFVVCLVLLAGTTELSRGLVIGDSGTGAPELRANSRYNHDDRQIATTYNIGTDVLSIIVEAENFSGDRKSIVEGKRVSVRVDLGGRRIIKKKK